MITRPGPATKPLPVATGPLRGVTATASTRVSGFRATRDAGHAIAVASAATKQSAPSAARFTARAPSWCA